MQSTTLSREDPPVLLRVYKLTRIKLFVKFKPIVIKFSVIKLVMFNKYVTGIIFL